MEFDTDPQAAAATRKRVFDMAVTDRQLIAGMHVHFPASRIWLRRGQLPHAAGAVEPSGFPDR